MSDKVPGCTPDRSCHFCPARDNPCSAPTVFPPSASKWQPRLSAWCSKASRPCPMRLRGILALNSRTSFVPSTEVFGLRNTTTRRRRRRRRNHVAVVSVSFFLPVPARRFEPPHAPSASPSAPCPCRVNQGPAVGDCTPTTIPPDPRGDRDLLRPTSPAINRLPPLALELI